MEADEIRLLDELAGHATAASEVVRYEGWLLRATAEAPFRRANSVTPNGPVTDLDAAIGAVDDFYAARALPARYQLSPGAQPPGLDDDLAARGYVVEAPVVVAVADTETVTSRTGGNGRDARATTGIDDAWIEHYASVHADDGVAQERIRAYGRLLGRLDLPIAVAVAPGDAPPLALGFAVAERGWAGIFGMGTRTTARRQGLAKAVLHALAAWAGAHEAPRLYLQVETDNPSARTLYARAGFADAYGYHYRTRS